MPEPIVRRSRRRVNERTTRAARFALIALLVTCASPYPGYPGHPEHPGTAVCAETFTLRGDPYPVPARWCGQVIDPASLPSVGDLVRLPADFSFADYGIYLAPRARDAFARMAERAARDGILLRVDSGYRSRSYQTSLLLRRIEEGQDLREVLRVIAPPGYSEHETGRAVDLVPSDPEFAREPAYEWLRRHAGSFGFRESYPLREGADAPWEPWHWSLVSGGAPSRTQPHSRPGQAPTFPVR